MDTERQREVSVELLCPGGGRHEGAALGGPKSPTSLQAGGAEAGRGLHPHSGLLWRRRGPRGSRTQGREQHGPPQDEVPLRREGCGSAGSCGLMPSNKWQGLSGPQLTTAQLVGCAEHEWASRASWALLTLR